jgi:glutamate decarboxylase
MIAPFVQPNLIWDFRISRVASINTSGHKYGLVYPGIGWIVWRIKDLLPKSLIFMVSYLGGEMPTFALNFSRPGAQILLQYWSFLRYGFEGYRTVQQTAMDVAQYLAKGIAEMGPFELWNDASDIPVFAWMLKADKNRNWTLYDLSDRLRMRGWQIPAYPMPDNLVNITVQRIVVRNGLSMDLAGRLLDEIKTEVSYLNSINVKTTAKSSGFRH